MSIFLYEVDILIYFKKINETTKLISWSSIWLTLDYFLYFVHMCILNLQDNMQVNKSSFNLLYIIC